MKTITIFIECSNYEDLEEIKEDIRNSGGIVENWGVDYLYDRGWIKTSIPDGFWKAFNKTKSRIKIIS
jgi:hypothetical protein